MDHLSSGESSKPHSSKKAFLIGELEEAKRTIVQKEEEMRQMEERLQKDWKWWMKDPKDKGGTIIDMNQEVFQLIMAMLKKPNGEGKIMKIGINKWQSLIYHL